MTTTYLAMMLDYTGLPRAWGKGPDAATAERVAREQLAKYCAAKAALGEPDLADPSRFALSVEVVS